MCPKGDKIPIRYANKQIQPINLKKTEATGQQRKTQFKKRNFF